MGDEPDTQPRKLVVFVAHMEPKRLDSSEPDPNKRPDVERDEKGEKP